MILERSLWESYHYILLQLLKHHAFTGSLYLEVISVISSQTFHFTHEVTEGKAHYMTSPRTQTISDEMGTRAQACDYIYAKVC